MGPLAISQDLEVVRVPSAITQVLEVVRVPLAITQGLEVVMVHLAITQGLEVVMVPLAITQGLELCHRHKIELRLELEWDLPLVNLPNQIHHSDLLLPGHQEDLEICTQQTGKIVLTELRRDRTDLLVVTILQLQMEELVATTLMQQEEAWEVRAPHNGCMISLP